MHSLRAARLLQWNRWRLDQRLHSLRPIQDHFIAARWKAKQGSSAVLHFHDVDLVVTFHPAANTQSLGTIHSRRV